MYAFGKSSKERLATVDGRLKAVFEKAINLGIIDISILCGTRGEREQNRVFKEGLSKLQYPNSKHNAADGEYSKAVDAGPYINGKVSYDRLHCCYLAGVIIGVASGMGYRVRWGGDWDMDGEAVTDQSFQDLLHYEIIED